MDVCGVNVEEEEEEEDDDDDEVEDCNERVSCIPRISLTSIVSSSGGR